MKVALFVPCYIDQFFPRAAIATLEVLESLGLEIDVPLSQVCCGQPFVNAGTVSAANPLIESFLKAYESYDYVVCPSASCVSMVRNHYHRGSPVESKVVELCEFLHDIIGPRPFLKPYPQKIILHQGCHGLRELGLGRCSELGGAREKSKVEVLLESVPGVELMHAKRTDECCGFGGTFAVMEADVSSAMGRSRLEDFQASGAVVVVSTDMSCLMHLDGLIRRDNTPLRIAHVAEVFAGMVSDSNNCAGSTA